MVKGVIAIILIKIYYDSLISNAYAEGIVWQIKNPPITFGEDVILYCNASAATDCCSNTVTWMKDYDVILHHGTPANITKYQQIKDINGFSLKIKSFNEDDINCQYTCLYDFYAFSRTLNMNNTDLQLIPSSTTIKADVKVETRKMSAHLNFVKVYPIPQCESTFNEEILICNSSLTKRSNGLFFNTTIDMVCKMKLEYCEGNISVLCLIGKRNITIDTRVESRCQLDIDGFSKQVIAGMVSVIVLTVVSVISISTWIKSSRRSITRLLTGDTYPGNHTPTDLGTDGYIEENEITPLLPFLRDSNQDSQTTVFKDEHKIGNELTFTDNYSFHRKTYSVPAQRSKDVKMILKINKNFCDESGHRL